VPFLITRPGTHRAQLDPGKGVLGQRRIHPRTSGPSRGQQSGAFTVVAAGLGLVRRASLALLPGLWAKRSSGAAVFRSMWLKQGLWWYSMLRHKIAVRVRIMGLLDRPAERLPGVDYPT
jgi:hypothetical protein